MSNPTDKTSEIKPRLLGDALIKVVDDVRRCVHGALGTRPYRVEIVTRTWSGIRRGEGIASDRVLVLDPIPAVVRTTKDRLGPGGRERVGGIKLEGISLRYSYGELMPKADNRTEVAWRIVELHGQRQGVRWFTPDGDPVPRRGDKPGDATDWVVALNETAPLSNLEKVNTP